MLIVEKNVEDFVDSLLVHLANELHCYKIILVPENAILRTAEQDLLVGARRLLIFSMDVKEILQVIIYREDVTLQTVLVLYVLSWNLGNNYS